LKKKYLQEVVKRVKDFTDGELGVVDVTGFILAGTDMTKIGRKIENFEQVMNSQEQHIEIGEILYHKLYFNEKLALLTYIYKNSGNPDQVLGLFDINIATLLTFYDDKYDKQEFVKNILHENILPGDISIEAKRLGFDQTIGRVVYLVKTKKGTESCIYTQISTLIKDKGKDFVIQMDDESTVLVKAIDSEEDMQAFTQEIVQILQADNNIKFAIGVSSVVHGVKQIGVALKEAQMAILVGRIFHQNKVIINYNSLGICRLIYQLPKTLCTLYLEEVFKGRRYDFMDTETIETIEKFFTNNLNVSQTARDLFIHRNTLVYRLDRVYQLIGLDLRVFEDALKFKVGMMIKDYLARAEESVY
jgi:carbohydrate diacid regulator